MDLQLNGKTALVTGSTAGIGLAIANTLAREGANVIVNGRSASSVERAVGRIKQAGAKGDVRGVAADLGNAKGVEQLVGAVAEVDILVNNLGIFEPKAFEEISDADWNAVLRGQRDERCALEPSLSAENERTQLGPDRFHIE